MLATKAQYSLSNAEEYFKEHLQVGDYYMEGRRVMGQWIGQGAESLGLSGMTHTDEFLKLCRNLHPTTGERLTQRHNGTRMEAGKDGSTHEVANRRVFFDFTFSPPKSVSIAALVGDDWRILEAHDEAVQVALRQLEMYAATRVRKERETSYRLTGNLVGAVFRHDTSRALDPHLHTHCILFNATRDSVENRWKALETCEMLMAKKFTIQVYYHELTKALIRFGYGIENNPRGDFEIRGVSQELIERFSKRHQEIDRKTRELLAKEPEKAGRNINAIRDHIAHKERARKIKDVGIARLQSLWNGQLSSDERIQLSKLDRNTPLRPDAPKMTAAEAVEWAEDHLFDRRSVVREQELWRHALEHARGRGVSLAGAKVLNGELATVKQVHPDGRIALADGRTLDKSYRQFVRGFAVTSYAAQGKTVDYVLFSDSAVQAATNDQQWYVTISRGRKGIQIFTADKIQLRQNVIRSGSRELALDIAKESVVHALAKAWGRDIGYVLSIQHSQRQTAQRRAELFGQAEAAKVSEAAQQTETPKQSESVRQSPAIRPARRITQSQQYKHRYGGGIGV